MSNNAKALRALICEYAREVVGISHASSGSYEKSQEIMARIDAVFEESFIPRVWAPYVPPVEEPA